MYYLKRPPVRLEYFFKQDEGEKRVYPGTCAIGLNLLKLVLSHVSDGLFSVRNALVRLGSRHVDVFELLDVLVRDGQVDLGC